MSIRKVKRGDPFAVEAREWNLIADSINRGAGQTAGRRGSLDPNFITVRNNLGRDLPRFAAVVPHRDASAAIPTANEDYIFTLSNGSINSLENDLESPQIGILAEPIANGRIGRAQVAGVALARVSNEGRSGSGVSSQYANRYCELSDLGDCLRFSSQGSVRVLHVTAHTTERLCLVLLGGNHPSLASSRFAATRTTAGVRAVTPQVSDHYGVGSYCDDVSKIFLARPGRYEVSIAWKVYVYYALTGNEWFEWTSSWQPWLGGFVHEAGGSRHWQFGASAGPLCGGTHIDTISQFTIEGGGAIATEIPAFPTIQIAVRGFVGIQPTAQYTIDSIISIKYLGQSTLTAPFTSTQAAAIYARGAGGPTI